MRKFDLLNNSILSVRFLFIVSSFLFCACGNTRHLTYMQGQFDTARLSQVLEMEPVVQKGDLLSIVVYSDNPTATAIYNQQLIITQSSSGANSSTGNSAGATSNGSGMQASASPTTPGYLVDENGNIEFQGLGLLHVLGLTRTDIKKLLDSKLLEFLTNPYYTIRFLNYKFTVIGEVNHPGVFSIPGDHLNLWEALGLAGDLTFYGKRDNVLVIREKNSKREFGRLDLTKPDVMASPYFILQPNDILIVEQTNKKVYANDQATLRTITITTSVISALALIINVLRR